MMRKRILCILLALALAAGFFPPAAVSAEEERPADLPQEVTIYALDEDDQAYLTIPEDLPQSWSTDIGYVRRISGRDLDIKNGIVRPFGEMWYWFYNSPGGPLVGTTDPDTENIVDSYLCYDFGNAVIRVDEKWDVTVHVVDYEEYYADQVMDAYLDAHVTEGMTEYQIAELCCQFVAGYDYSAETTGYVAMISRGGGDCWASTSALIHMLRKFDIQCQDRDASSDPGAGSSHRNAVARLDGQYYILEAGYDTPAPREYDIREMQTSSIYTYRRTTGPSGDPEICITGLVIGQEFTHLEIPSELEGLPVTVIDDNAFYGTELVTVVLPDTIRRIGTRAFADCYDLESINLPPSLTTIEMSCFNDCRKLKELNIPASVTNIEGMFVPYCYGLEAINVHEDNPNYTSQDGVLFDKSMQTLLIYPAGKNRYVEEGEDDPGYDYTIPDSVTFIETWAFSNVRLNSLKIPSSVQDIASMAFYWCVLDELTIPEGIERIRAETFRYARLGKLTLPSTLKIIEDSAFYGGNNDSLLVIPEGVEHIGNYAFAQCDSDWISIPSTVRVVGTNAFNLSFAIIGGSEARYSHGALFLEEGWQPEVMGENVFGDETLCGYSGSYMHTYAQENGLYWYPRNSDGTVSLKQEWLLEKTGVAYAYTGEAIEPEYDWAYGSQPIPFGIPSFMVDVSYADNIHIGYGDLIVRGKGLLSGTLTIPFEICRSDPSRDVIDLSGCGLQFAVMDDHVEIAGYIESKVSENLVIPDTLLGLPVTAVADDAFRFGKVIRELTLPASVTRVGEYAFSEMRQIEKIHFQGDMPVFGENAMYKAVGYYPLGNETWKLSELREARADGWISWCATHQPGEWITELEPTCLQEGLRVRSCPACGVREEEILAKTDHNVESLPAVAPTCTAPGLTEGSRCTVCETILTAQQEVAQLGHTYIPTVQPPSCTEQGYTDHICACGDSYANAYTEPTGHIPGAPAREDDPGTGACMLVTRCTVCAAVMEQVLGGDIDGDNDVDADDAVYLLYHSLFGDTAYPVSRRCDMDGSGKVNADDAVYLLYHTLFGAQAYPLMP